MTASIVCGSAERRELRASDATPRVLGALAEGDEPEEHLLARIPAGLVHRLEQLLGPPGERTGDPSDLPVGVEREHALGAPLGELGERVLQERQRARVVRDVGDHLGQKSRLDNEPGAVGGGDDRALELLRRHRRDRFGSRREQVAEAGDGERGVVEVRPECRHDADPASADRRLLPEALKKVRPFGIVVDQREDLLELVDDDHELCIGVGQDAIDRSHQSELVALEDLHERGSGLDRQAHERSLDVAEWVVSREDVDDVPALGTGDRSPPNRRDEAGVDDRGLPRTRRSRHRRGTSLRGRRRSGSGSAARVTRFRPKKSRRRPRGTPAAPL